MSFQAIPVWFLCKLCGASFQKVEKFIEHKKLNHGNEFQNIKGIVFEEKSGNTSQETEVGNSSVVGDTVIITIPDRLKQVFPDTFHIEGTTQPIYLTAVSASDTNFTNSNPPTSTAVNENPTNKIGNSDDGICYSIQGDPTNVQVNIKSEGDWIVDDGSNSVSDEILGIDPEHDRSTPFNFNPNFFTETENCIINTPNLNPPRSAVSINNLSQVDHFFQPKTELSIFTSSDQFKTNVEPTTSTKEKNDGEARPFVCELCGQGFKQLVTLKNHQTVHTDLRPFKCPHFPCTANFKTSKGLGQHTSLSTPM